MKNIKRVLLMAALPVLLSAAGCGTSYQASRGAYGDDVYVSEAEAVTVTVPQRSYSYNDGYDNENDWVDYGYNPYYRRNNSWYGLGMRGGYYNPYVYNRYGWSDPFDYGYYGGGRFGLGLSWGDPWYSYGYNGFYNPWYGYGYGGLYSPWYYGNPYYGYGYGLGYSSWWPYYGYGGYGNGIWDRRAANPRPNYTDRGYGSYGPYNGNGVRQQPIDRRGSVYDNPRANREYTRDRATEQARPSREGYEPRYTPQSAPMGDSGRGSWGGSSPSGRSGRR